MYNRNTDRETIERFFDAKIERYGKMKNSTAKAKTKQAQEAKKIFLRYLDEGETKIV